MGAAGFEVRKPLNPMTIRGCRELTRCRTSEGIGAWVLDALNANIGFSPEKQTGKGTRNRSSRWKFKNGFRTRNAGVRSPPRPNVNPVPPLGLFGFGVTAPEGPEARTDPWSDDLARDESPDTVMR
jgi:hypothetical protein